MTGSLKRGAAGNPHFPLKEETITVSTHSFGGSAMDRYLFDFETVMDAAPAGDPGAAGDPGPAGALPDAPAEGDLTAPAAPAASFDPSDPGFLDAVQTAAAEMFESRVGPLIAQANAQARATGQPEQQINLDEFLNPLSDTFGTNIAQFLSQRDQWLLSQIDERFAPMRSREEAAQIEQGQARMDDLITAGWQEARDGKLSDPVRVAIKDLAPAYLDEMTARYGSGPMAAQQALVKATDTIRQINAGAATAGGQSNADQLAALAAASGEPGTGGGAMNVPPPARSPREVLARMFPPNGNAAY